MSEPTEQEVQDVADYIGSHSSFAGMLTVDRSNETSESEDKTDAEQK